MLEFYVLPEQFFIRKLFQTYFALQTIFRCGEQTCKYVMVTGMIFLHINLFSTDNIEYRIT